MSEIKSDPEQSYIVPAPADDVGPLPIPVPGLIGLCGAHGWWFECEPGASCPEAGCRALVHYYRHSCAAIQEGNSS